MAHLGAQVILDRASIPVDTKTSVCVSSGQFWIAITHHMHAKITLTHHFRACMLGQAPLSRRLHISCNLRAHYLCSCEGYVVGTCCCVALLRLLPSYFGSNGYQCSMVVTFYVFVLLLGVVHFP